LPGCAAAPAVNLASQMLMQNQHSPAQADATQTDATQADAPQTDAAQTAQADPAPADGTQPAAAPHSQPASSATANPLALLGAGLPSAASIASLAQHLGLPVGGLVPGMQAIAHAQSFLLNPNAAHPAPTPPATDTEGDPPVPAKVAAASQ
ncbi:MAG: hypothetical protein JSR21_18500, partial [Proteobacteria bacterium]|nr:hypothetical protein [Pseudomonadota bacterium]